MAKEIEKEEVIQEKKKTSKVEDVQTVEVRRRELASKYRKEKKIGVSISPMYRPYFGSKMAVSINGIAVYVPCDGKVYNLPKIFAVEVMSRIRKIDEMITKKERMMNIAGNVESSPGDLKFF